LTGAISLFERIFNQAGRLLTLEGHTSLGSIGIYHEVGLPSSQRHGFSHIIQQWFDGCFEVIDGFEAVVEQMHVAVAVDEEDGR
jgi:hypothetical protein